MVDLQDFRPISPNSFYKLLAKDLVSRMEELMGLIISPSQNAFVKGRQLLDSSLIANECIDHWTKSKEQHVVCHIDMEKVYDRVNWDFLDWVLDQMGFGRKWRFWMRLCISTTSFSVLLNGFPINFERGSCGLR